MAVIFHMKDGNNISLTAASAVRPYQNAGGVKDENFVEGLSAEGTTVALVPVENLDVAEVQ